MPTLSLNLERLIATHCRNLEFNYGDRTVTAGSEECRVVLNLIEVDGRHVYSGTVCVPGEVVDGLKGMPFQLVAYPHENLADVVAIGRLADGGAFQFALSTGLLGTKCVLQLNPIVRSRQNSFPRQTLRRSPRLTTGNASSRLLSVTGHMIGVDARFVTVKVPTDSAPYNLLCVASREKSTNDLLAVKLVHLDVIPDTQFSRARCDRGSLMKGRPQSEVFIDAWPVTTDPETRFLVTRKMLQEISNSDPKTASDVVRLSDNLRNESDISTTDKLGEE